MLKKNQFGNSENLDRQRGGRIPRHLAHAGKVEAREGAAFLDTALGENPAPRLHHRLVAGAHAAQLQREVRFDTGREVSLAAGKNRPTAIGVLRIEQHLLEALFEVLVDRLHEVQEDDVLGIHLRVRFERGVPVALGMLLLDQRALRAIDGEIQFGGEFVALETDRARRATSYIL